MNRFPKNGERLLHMRQNHMRPAGLLLVSMIGNLPYSNFTLYSQPGIAHDWHMIVGLEVELMANLQVPFSSVLATLNALAGASPGHLALAYAEGPRVDCGVSRNVLEAINPNRARFVFDWHPSAVWPHYADAKALERRIWSELGNALATPYESALIAIQPKLRKERARGADDS